MSSGYRYAMALVGRRNTGKSTTLLEDVIKNYKRGDTIIIIDPNGSPAYKEYPYVTSEQLGRLKSGIVRFYDSDKKRMWQILCELYSPTRVPRKYLNGCMIIEDATKLIGANPPDNVIAMLVDGRMWNADLIFTFHSLWSVPPKFWDFITHLILKKTQDMIEENKKSYSSRIPNFQAWYPAWCTVMKHKSEYIYKTIRTLI